MGFEENAHEIWVQKLGYLTVLPNWGSSQAWTISPVHIF
jgi:hypothetical protein